VIVVDTNVIAYLRITGVHTPLAEQVLRKDPEWHAPLLWRSEFRNVLAGYLRRNLLDLTTASRIMTEAESHLASREYLVPSAEVLRRVFASTCSACDCEFVVLAEEMGLPLVTTDKQLLSAFPRIAISPQAFLSRS
jgi:predicted nucleic acid-binding protein